MDEKAIYETLSRRDVQNAADEFRPLYDENGRRRTAMSALRSIPTWRMTPGAPIQEARRLWGALNRPNVLIKVPATVEGLPAIRQLISEGINVNVTLALRAAALPAVRGRVHRRHFGAPGPGGGRVALASVASFFVSRMDTLVDPLLEKIAAKGGWEADLARKARGQSAIASAKMAYQIYKEIFGSDRFRGLAARGARVQRVLWASTGTKNPDYERREIRRGAHRARYGQHDPGRNPRRLPRPWSSPGPPRELDVGKAAEILAGLAKLGIRIDDMTQQLEDEGVEKFNKPFDKLMETLAQRSLRYLE